MGRSQIYIWKRQSHSRNTTNWRQCFIPPDSPTATRKRLWSSLGSVPHICATYTIGAQKSKAWHIIPYTSFIAWAGCSKNQHCFIYISKISHASPPCLFYIHAKDITYSNASRYLGMCMEFITLTYLEFITTRILYNTADISPNMDKWYPIARPRGMGKGCLFPLKV